MRVLLGARPPEAKDRAEVVLEKLRARHVLTALAEVDLGPVLEARRLRGGRALESGRLSPEPALDLLLADAGVAPSGLSGRPDVAAALKPEVVVPDVATSDKTQRRILRDAVDAVSEVPDRSKPGVPRSFLGAEKIWSLAGMRAASAVRVMETLRTMAAMLTGTSDVPDEKVNPVVSPYCRPAG